MSDLRRVDVVADRDDHVLAVVGREQVAGNAEATAEVIAPDEGPDLPDEID